MAAFARRPLWRAPWPAGYRPLSSDACDGQRDRGRGVGAIEPGAPRREAIDRRRSRRGIAVRPDAIGTQRIDRDEDDIARDGGAWAGGAGDGLLHARANAINSRAAPGANRSALFKGPRLEFVMFGFRPSRRVALSRPTTASSGIDGTKPRVVLLARGERIMTTPWIYDFHVYPRLHRDSRDGLCSCPRPRRRLARFRRHRIRRRARGQVPPHRHPHRRGHARVRGLQVPRALSVRWTDRR